VKNLHTLLEEPVPDAKRVMEGILEQRFGAGQHHDYQSSHDLLFLEGCGRKRSGKDKIVRMMHLGRGVGQFAKRKTCFVFLVYDKA
jgi:putative component of toxin-antitoxin plasmid stabilization module